MVKLTRDQRRALKRVYDRMPVYAYDGKTLSEPRYWEHKPMTYREFRKTVKPTFACDNCIMVSFAGMWLGIETDGYTHS